MLNPFQVFFILSSKFVQDPSLKIHILLPKFKFFFIPWVNLSFFFILTAEKVWIRFYIFSKKILYLILQGVRVRHGTVTFPSVVFLTDPNLAVFHLPINGKSFLEWRPYHVFFWFYGKRLKRTQSTEIKKKLGFCGLGLSL